MTAAGVADREKISDADAMRLVKDGKATFIPPTPPKPEMANRPYETI